LQTFATFAEAKAAGAPVIGYGVFLNTVLDFLIVAAAIFLLVSWANRLQRTPEPAPAAPTTKECPHCISQVPLKATRCPHCTSQLS
jgi:large conductance mechanosensitive channel